MLEAERPDPVSLCLGNLDHFAPTMAVLEVLRSVTSVHGASQLGVHPDAAAIPLSR